MCVYNQIVNPCWRGVRSVLFYWKYAASYLSKLVPSITVCKTEIETLMLLYRGSYITALCTSAAIHTPFTAFNFLLPLGTYNLRIPRISLFAKPRYQRWYLYAFRSRTWRAWQYEAILLLRVSLSPSLLLLFPGSYAFCVCRHFFHALDCPFIPLACFPTFLPILLRLFAATCHFVLHFFAILFHLCL